MESETTDELQDANDITINTEDEAIKDNSESRNAIASVLSVMSALEGDPVSQVSADENTGVKQPRSLATIDDILVSKTQPEPEEELEDMFEYSKPDDEDIHEELEETEPVEEMAEDNETEEVASAQQNIAEPDTFNTVNADKENDPNATNDTRMHRMSQFPLSKIKKMMKMDPDTKNLTNESVLLLAYSTELFVRSLATAAAREAVKSKRKTIKREDIDKCVNSLGYFEFLEDML